MNGRDADHQVVDWPPRRPPRRPIGRILLIVFVAALLFGGGTWLTYYVDSLWFGSLGYGDVFWTTLNLQAETFLTFTVVTFLVLYGSYLALKPARLGEIAGGSILINGQPLRLPVEPVLRLMALGGSIGVALLTGVSMMAQWSTLALYWNGGRSTAGLPASAALVDPILGRTLNFYLFTLPAWRLLSSWLLTLVVLITGMATFFAVITSGSRLFSKRRDQDSAGAWRGLSIGLAMVLLTLAVRAYLSRFEQLLDDNPAAIFSGVGYTDAHVTLTGLLVVAAALVAGAGIALVNAVSAPKLRWLAVAIAPGVVCYGGVLVAGWYVDSFIVKPNELVRESPYIAHNIELTRRAYGLERVTEQPFPADSGLEALDAANNQETLRNIRLWDWQALRDTLRQIQEIRTYYDFPDIDIDRYTVNGSVRQMMLAVRELNVERLPGNSRNWINEKLIYTHGYGVTMNPVNGFTGEGLPSLVLSNMPIESTIPGLTVSRPEIYFGQLTNTDVYVRTRQKEFNYPQGETNSVTTYEGTGGIALNGFVRRLLVAGERGDITKVPFSDDITNDSRLLMRRNIRERAATLAPFLTLDTDPYIVIGEDGRLTWLLDGYTTASSFPYARHYLVGGERLNYIRNNVKIAIDAYDGSATFYVFDADDPVVAVYRRIFPSLFKDASAMPASLRAHVRYPELLLEVQAAVYGLYHMTDPGVFYNREDLWSVATEVGMNANRQQGPQVVDPNFVLMTLPGEQKPEFIEILPFTPSNRNNLIGWIAGRSDDPHYGSLVVYNFPKTKLVDGPLQIEARIDQNAQLSGQLSLWNQQGSSVRRGSLLVIPLGRALLYAEPIYLQAEHSPMPELRIVVLALQDRLAYAPTFDAALAALFGTASSTLAGAAPAPPAATPAAANTTPAAQGDVNALIAQAARDLADYQRLTAEGKLGEAGQKLESLKRALDVLARPRR